MTKKLLFLFALLPSILAAQHSIKGTFTPAEDYKMIILYKVTPTTSIYIDYASVNEKGNLVVDLILCRGCGTCESVCPSKAIELTYFRDDQYMAILDELLPLEE